MNPKDLINWRKLSEMLTGNPTYIRKNFVPNKYKSQVDSIVNAVKYQLKLKS